MEKRNATCSTPKGYTKVPETAPAPPLTPAGRPSQPGRRIKAYPKRG